MGTELSKFSSSVPKVLKIPKNILNKTPTQYILLPKNLINQFPEGAVFMRKNVFFALALLSVFTLIGVSCKSTPEPAPAAPKPAVQQAPDQSLNTLRDPVSRAEEARQRAIDFDSPLYFPSEWEGLETQYAAAGNMPKTTPAEIQQAVTAYNAVAEAYDDIFKKAIPLYAQAREDEIISARDELISTGFTNYFPQYLQNADDLALSALDQYEAEDYYASKDTAAKALKEYETLLLGSKVFLARQEILNRGFRDYDPDNFDLADEVAQTAIQEYEAGNKEAAVNNAEEALLRYNIVLANGWVIYAADRRASAASERELALSERANIAARETFRSADTLFNSAEENFKAEKYSDAGLLFIDAEANFAISRQETEEKRLRAEEAIRLAEEKVEESNETAIEAERIIEGGSK